MFSFAITIMSVVSRSAISFLFLRSFKTIIRFHYILAYSGFFHYLLLLLLYLLLLRGMMWKLKLCFHIHCHYTSLWKKLRLFYMFFIMY